MSVTTTEIYLHLDRKFLTEVINTFHPRKNMIVYIKETIEYTRTKIKKDLLNHEVFSFYLANLDGVQNNYFAMLTALVSLITVTF
jgi:hypothetical protein